MNIIVHDLKVAFRNLMKYKLQTLICIVSIAIGIVTLSFTHSLLKNWRLSAIYDQPFRDRAYNLCFKKLSDGSDAKISLDAIRAVKSNGGPKNAEKIVVAVGGRSGVRAEFHLPDSTVRRGFVEAEFIDPEYLSFIGFRSAITGKKITSLKPGEAIIGEEIAKVIFKGKNPIGAVQTIDGPVQTIPVTIVDVYKSLSVQDSNTKQDILYFCLAERIEDQESGAFFLVPYINVVLKEGGSERQLLDELNERVKPLGLKAELSKTLNDVDLQEYISLKGLTYVISSLILLAAIIGFLRIQTQLFQLRRRELALRIVNGATRLRIFGLLVVEILITIFSSALLSIFLGYWLEDFLLANLDILVIGSGIYIRDLWIYSISIGICLMIICSLIAWIALVGVFNAGQGLAKNMRRSRNHTFRNVMLGIQIAISLVFVSCTFIIIRDGELVLKMCNIPENDKDYKEYLSLWTSDVQQIDYLLDEIKKLPELDRLVMCDRHNIYLEDAKENPEAMEAFYNRPVFRCYDTDDPDMPDLIGMDVEWLNDGVDRNECLLVSEKLYSKLNDFGILNKGTLTFACSGEKHYLTLPIAGIIKNIPYDTDGESFVAITSYWRTIHKQYTLFPKAGKGKALARSVKKTIERVEPETIGQMIYNFRVRLSEKPAIVETCRTLGTILGCISLIICAMSIFSTIALDTRARQKEMAIRKVNGAKSRDIYAIFGKIYVVLIVASLFISVPVCFIFNTFMELGPLHEMPKDLIVSPIGPILLGIAVVTLLIILIVGWQIHKMMQADPAKIIAKE